MVVILLCGRITIIFRRSYILSRYTGIIDRFYTDSGDDLSDETGPCAVALATTTLTVVYGVQRVRERGVFRQRFQQVDQVAAVPVIWLDVGRFVIVRRP